MNNPAISNLRLAAKQVTSQSAAFNGVIEVALIPADIEQVTFYANVKVFTGDAQLPSYTFTPCTDKGTVREFNDIDDIAKWLNSAYTDITSISFSIADYRELAREYVPPTDAAKDAIKNKAAFTKLVAKVDANLVVATAKLASDVASGWNLPTAHPALQAIHAEDLAIKDALTATKAYYVGRVAFYNNIINPN